MPFCHIFLESTTQLGVVWAISVSDHKVHVSSPLFLSLLEGGKRRRTSLQSKKKKKKKGVRKSGFHDNLGLYTTAGYKSNMVRTVQ